MNAVKKLLGYVWMLMAPALICFLVYQAVEKISAAS
jgi:ABC-type polysaccharide/polyol phosphate export permease